MSYMAKNRRWISPTMNVVAVAVLIIIAFVVISNTNKIHPEVGFDTSGYIFNNDIILNRKTPEVIFHPSWPPLIPSPQKEYPPVKSLLSVVQNWNPDDSDPPAQFQEVLQHFNYSNPGERVMAMNYLEAELPFKLYNVPEFDATAAKWTDSYLANNLGSYRVEKSKTNHFMFWNGGARHVKDFKPPTEVVKMTFLQWLKQAKQADEEKLPADTEHYYLVTGAPPHDTVGFIGKDLPLFSSKEANFFIRKPKLNKGIQCRFGMRLATISLLYIQYFLYVFTLLKIYRGVIAESHYDAGRNMVVMLKGRKRYILNPPSACEKLGIIADRHHPSFRHSVIDWSSVPQAVASGFQDVPAIDTVINTGEVLYIPSYWFHYIMSLEYSAQCNSRHGSPPKGEGFGEAFIDKCFQHDK